MNIKQSEGGIQLEFRSCINYLLTVAHREVKQQLAARLKEYNLTPGQYGILNYLWEHEQATPKELSQTLMESTPVISALLDRLQKQGLINRCVDAEDRRSIQVSLTEEGLNLKQGVLNMVDDLNIASMERVDPEKREVLLDCLRQLSSIE